MKRYLSYQQLPWQDRTISKLEELRFDKCLSILQATDPMSSIIETADQTVLYAYCREKGNATCDSTKDIDHLRDCARDLMIRDLEQDVDYLTQKEYSLLVKMLLHEGNAVLETASEAEAAMMMRAKLWCRLKNDEGMIAAKLDDVLIKPLSENIIRPEHLACRNKILAFDTMLSSALYIWGFFDGASAVERFTESVLNGIFTAEHLKIALEYVKVEYDYIENQNSFVLLNESLAVPDDWVEHENDFHSQPSLNAIVISMPAITGCTSEEMVISEKMALVLQDVLRPEYEIGESILTLQLMIKQDAPWEALVEVLRSMIYMLPSEYMLQTLRELIRNTTKWDIPWIVGMNREIFPVHSRKGSAIHLN